MEHTERENAIINALEEKGFASVKELSALLYTSASSIRRDLLKLEEKKIIKRTHGGAVLSLDKTVISPFFARKATNTEQKAIAAKKAAHLLKDSMTVMLDGSSTALQILPYLKEHVGIRLFTNSIYTFKSALKMGLEAYCLGGAPSTDSETLAGSITESAVSSLYVDMLFFSSKCVSEQGDITDPLDSETRLRKAMLSHAKTRVFLYDSSKMGKTDLYKLCNIRDIEYSFSDMD